MTWANKPLDPPASDVVAAVRSGIPVKSIATPRAELVSREKCLWPGCVDEPELEPFDYVPVTVGDEIVGLGDRLSGGLRDLSEAMLLSSDSGLLSYVEIADRQQFAFLVEHNRIAGLVTLSDIQKLPVYCVVFALLMSVEMLLMEWIRRECRMEPDRWLSQLDDESRRRIEKHWKRAQQRNVALDRLSCASFADELNAARRLRLFSAKPDAIDTLERLKDLRNLICHGMEIALTPDRALEIPADVRAALRIQRLLEDDLKAGPA